MDKEKFFRGIIDMQRYAEEASADEIGQALELIAYGMEVSASYLGIYEEYQDWCGVDEEDMAEVPEPPQGLNPLYRLKIAGYTNPKKAGK